MDPLAPVTSVGPSGRSIRQIVAAWRGKRDVPRWPQLPPERTFLTYQGRNAVALACKLLGVGEGDEVLAPSYNCGAEIDALLASGATVSLYRVDRDGFADVDDVLRRATPRTRAVYVVHPFGRPQPLDAIADACRARGLLLVEDCALALFSRDASGRPVGLAGDAAIFSFRKSLPVPDGGALVLAKPPARRPPRFSPPSPVLVARRTLGLLKRRHVGDLRLARSSCRTPSQTARPDMPASYYWDQRFARWSASEMTRAILGQIDPDDVVMRRRANYERLSDALRGVPDARPLMPSLPDGACPVGFPLVVRGRDRWIASLRARRISAIPWWAGFHRGLPWGDHPEACALKSRVVVLPVDQDLDADAMDRVADAVAKTSSELIDAPVV